MRPRLPPRPGRRRTTRPVPRLPNRRRRRRAAVPSTRLRGLGAAMSGPLPGDWFVTPTHADHLEALGGWLIRWGTNAPVNHAALYVGDGHLIEAAPSGVHRVK